MRNRTKKYISVLLAVIFIFCSMSGVSVIFAVEDTAVGEAASTDEGSWISAWSTSLIDLTIKELGSTVEKIGFPVLCMSMRTSIEPTMSGNKVRLVYSNEYGITPLKLTASSIAVTDENDTRVIKKETLVPVTFNGEKSVTIPAGEKITTDPIDFEVTAGQKITVNIYSRGFNIIKTVGLIGGDSYLLFGNSTKAEKVGGILMSVKADSGTYEIIPIVAEVDVLTSEKDASTCVVFGDSTVDNEFPRFLAAKLREEGITNISVTQAAIRGNRLAYEETGVFGRLFGSSGVDRFEKDVLDQAGVETVVIKIGANDIVHPYCESKIGKSPISTYEDMVSGYTKLIDMCHERGVKVYLCNIAPWKGYIRDVIKPQGDIHWTSEIDSLRLQINEWIASDACPADKSIITTELVDPEDPDAILPKYTTDGAHYTLEGTYALTDIFYSRMFAE